MEAARAVGASSLRILRCEILPNIVGPLVIRASLSAASAMLLESGLSFLGVLPSAPSWGLEIATARNHMFQTPYYVLWPSLALSVTILGINTMGDTWLELPRSPRARRVRSGNAGRIPAWRKERLRRKRGGRSGLRHTTMIAAGTQKSTHEIRGVEVSKMRSTRDLVQQALADGHGILRLEPAWVARDFLPPGRRLGVIDERYDLGDRGAICERWLASTTRADNRIGPVDEGLSYLKLDGPERVTLKEAVACEATMILGTTYAATHTGLDRLAKLFDNGTHVPYHVHPPRRITALVGRNPKEEAYYYPPGVDMGPHPESYFGVHRWIVEDRAYDTLLPYLVDWNSDLILRHAFAYRLVPDDGFHIPSGILHAPGTALTVELQEDSDVFAMMQALVAGRIISKELLFKDVRPEDRAREGERFILRMIEWELNGDPYFYEHRHTPPRPIAETKQSGGEEYWIFYNTLKFSGKKLVVRGHETYRTVDRGVYSVFVWSGRGTYGGHEIRGGVPGEDELLVSHDRAVTPLTVENTSDRELVILKFFGPDINPDVPMLPRRAGVSVPQL